MKNKKNYKTLSPIPLEVVGDSTDNDVAVGCGAVAGASWGVDYGGT